MILSIDTAIPLLEDDLEQILVPTTDDGYSELELHDIDIDVGDPKDINSFRTRTNHTAIGIDSWANRLLAIDQFLNGFWLGFIIQTVSFGSTAIIMIHWGDGNKDSPDSPPVSNQKHGFLYCILFVLSKSRWLLFPAIFLAIDEGLT